MPQLTRCPSCDRPLRVPDNLIGMAVKCPSCGTTFTAEPSPEGGSPPPAQQQEMPPPPRPRERDGDYFEDDYDDRPRRRRRRDLEPHRGTTVLVFGILSLVLFPIIFGPIAWIMGNNDLRKIRQGQMDREGEGTTNAGRICGIIGTILGILQCGIILLLISVGVFGAAVAPRNVNPPFNNPRRFEIQKPLIAPLLVNPW